MSPADVLARQGSVLETKGLNFSLAFRRHGCFCRAFNRYLPCQMPSERWRYSSE